MNTNKLTWLFMGIGGTLGGYVPLLWGENYFSFSAIIFSALGAIIGIWFAFKLTR